MPIHPAKTSKPNPGLGTRIEVHRAPVEAFLTHLIAHTPPLTIITICTGSALLARTTILNSRHATTNKKSWSWATAQGPLVHWVPTARWVVDEKEGCVPVWSSSGVSAGLDVMFAFVARAYGEDVARGIADGLEYERH